MTEEQKKAQKILQQMTEEIVESCPEYAEFMYEVWQELHVKAQEKGIS